MKRIDMDTLVKDINTIVDNIQEKDKTLALAKQRGYLTGWLARLALQHPSIRQEIELRLKNIKN